MYKREYRFSEIIDDLKHQVSEWKSTSYLPILGRAKLRGVSAPLFHDSWMGQKIKAELELHQDVTSVVINSSGSLTK